MFLCSVKLWNFKDDILDFDIWDDKLEVQHNCLKI